MSQLDAVTRPFLRRMLPVRVRRGIFNLRERQQAGADWTRLAHGFPELQNYGALAEPARKDLHAMHQRYIKEVSIPSMAISIELATFLMVLCRLFRPRRILDLGSGFSTAVFLQYAETEGTNVNLCSVDDSEQWLLRTRRFLESVGRFPMRLLTLQEFRLEEDERFDLVLHDLGSMETRLATLPDALGRLQQGGLAVLDDMHKQPYSAAARGIINQHLLNLLSLRAVTLDQIRRYAMLALSR